MSESAANPRNRTRRRAVLASLSLLTLLSAAGLILALVERIRDASDRAT
jgi:hypothetical protein